MKHTIHIHNLQKRIPVPLSRFKKAIQKILEQEKIKQAELSVVILTDRGIRAVNKRFLDHDFSTDVVTFDLSDGEVSRNQRFCAKEVEGEIYVSAVTATRQAKELSVLPEQELLLYIVHGILHLLGYDDHCAGDRKRMREKEKEILFKIGGLRAENLRK